MLSENERHIFRALDTDNDGAVSRHTIEHTLRLSGVDPHQSELAETFALIDALPPAQQQRLDPETFSRCLRPTISLFTRVVRGELVIPDFHVLGRNVEVLFEECLRDRSGATAAYIPELRNADPEPFALSIVSVDGQQLHLGEDGVPFTVQSTAKPISYCLAVEQNGLARVHAHVGREPSGRGFNEITLNEAGLPHNPMINAGAIMICSLLHRDLTVEERIGRIREVWQELAVGTDVGFDAAVCRSEAGTAYRNRALAYYMMEKKAFPEDTDLDETLDLYFRSCSLRLTCRQMAMVAATLAAGGVNPISNRRMFRPLTVQACLSLMSSCGMYDYSGEWAFRVGLPAKSGVSGVVMVVVPSVMGICLWSPRLDRCGNSVRGVRFCKELVNRFSLHAFDSIDLRSGKIDPLQGRIQAASRETAALIEAASNGDLMAVHHLLSIGADPSARDYDGRTPLHLAAAEGHRETMQFLLEGGADPGAGDRWGNTPLDDALLSGHGDVADLLLERGVAARTSARPEHRPLRVDNPVTTELVGFIWAAAEGDLISLRRYLARGVNPDHVDYDGRSALHLAASEGRDSVVRFLLDHGCRRERRDRWGSTPLDDALREGHACTARLLAQGSRSQPPLPLG